MDDIFNEEHRSVLKEAGYANLIDPSCSEYVRAVLVSHVMLNHLQSPQTYSCLLRVLLLMANGTKILLSHILFQI